MKTSNILLLIALILLLSTLMAYNMVLKKQYTSGEYKNPLKDHTLLGFTDFDEIEINDTNIIKVKIEAGDTHQVHQQQNTEGLIKVTQIGKRLQVDLDFGDGGKILSGHRDTYHIVIRTPELRLLKTDASHKHKVYLTDQQGVTVERLNQGQLALEMDNGSYVKLSDNQINSLTVNTGRSHGTEPFLHILPDNRLQQARLNIRNASLLTLENVAIPEVDYTFSDSAQVKLSGVSLAIIRK
jgi:hypothetical protein